jgi:hypothetical protein
MSNPAHWLSPTGTGVATAMLAYVGGILTKPLNDYITFVKRRSDLRLHLYSELGRLYSSYERIGYDSTLPIPVRSSTDAYKTAMQAPEVYYSLREKHFFDGLYRVILDVEGRRRRPVLAKTFVAFVDEAIMLGRVDRKFLRKHCDTPGQRHIDLIPKGILTEEELAHVLEQAIGRMSAA